MVPLAVSPHLCKPMKNSCLQGRGAFLCHNNYAWHRQAPWQNKLLCYIRNSVRAAQQVRRMSVSVSEFGWDIATLYSTHSPLREHVQKKSTGYNLYCHTLVATVYTKPASTCYDTLAVTCTNLLAHKHFFRSKSLLLPMISFTLCLHDAYAEMSCLSQPSQNASYKCRVFSNHGISQAVPFRLPTNLEVHHSTVYNLGRSAALKLSLWFSSVIHTHQRQIFM